MNSKHRTNLYEIHRSFGARFVDFAGYEMPVQYSSGVLKEHLHTRSAVGFFDVSHMGQIIVKPKTGHMSDAVSCLERLLPCDLNGLEKGRQCYSLLTNENGGLIDDLMITNMGNHFLIVVNASRKTIDYNYLKLELSDKCQVKMVNDRSLVAMQGPLAEVVLSKWSPIFADLRFLDSKSIELFGAECWVSRSGYTGEDGFEISIHNSNVEYIVSEFLKPTEVKPIGLGARDSLRLEAGLCLYGNELSEAITPIEASLNWAVHKQRRGSGSRQGGFKGAVKILDQLSNGCANRRVAAIPCGRAPIRSGCLLFADKERSINIGKITSGGFSPTLRKPIAMASIGTEFSDKGTNVFAELRGQSVAAVVSKLPFVATKYKQSIGRKK